MRRRVLTEVSESSSGTSPASTPAPSSSVFDDSSTQMPRRRPFTESTSESTSPAFSSVLTPAASDDDVTPPSKQEIRILFKRLCRSYIKHQRPPPDIDIAQLWNFSEYINYEDIICWKDEVGFRTGVIVDGGKVRFTGWPARPHDAIVSEFNQQFSEQFNARYRGTASYPVFVNSSTTDIYLLSRMNLTF
jgi:hypothetical protein